MITQEQVIEVIRQDIQSRGEGAELDSDGMLADRIGCSVLTVKRAMATLQQRGEVLRQKGRLTRATSLLPTIPANEFSFRHRAEKIHSLKLETQVIELTRRLPDPQDPDGSENRAQSFLKLKKVDTFYVIVRRRILDGLPRVIHRSYLNPAYFPPHFLTVHDFSLESLFDIFKNYHLEVSDRNSRIRAVMSTQWECQVLRMVQKPVLRVEQELFTVNEETGERIAAEYLCATYVDWEYVVSNRSAAVVPSNKP